MPDYQKKTVAELTEILKGRSLPHSGKKAELIARLNEADKAAEPAEAAPEPTSTAEPAPKAPAVAAEPETSKHTTDGSSAAPTTGTKSLASPDPVPTSREGSATTDAKLASAVDRSIGLTASSVDEELKKRKARAERFGTGATTTTQSTTPAEVDAEAIKALERAKRFGATEAEAGVGKLDEALPMEREKRGGNKRALEEGGGGGGGGYDDPGLKQGRGGKRRFPGRGGRDNNRRGERPDGVKKSGAAVNERDRAAAESRKRRFAAS